MMTRSFRRALLLLFFLSAVAVAAPANAQDRIGGHFGTVIPIVSRAGGSTTTISDQFKIGFPTGITVKTDSPWAFDLEFVPVVTRDRPQVSGLGLASARIEHRTARLVAEQPR